MGLISGGPIFLRRCARNSEVGVCKRNPGDSLRPRQVKCQGASHEAGTEDEEFHRLFGSKFEVNMRPTSLFSYLTRFHAPEKKIELVQRNADRYCKTLKSPLNGKVLLF